MNRYNTLKKELDEKITQLRRLNEETEKIKIELHEEALNEVLNENLLDSVTWELSRYSYTHPKNRRWCLVANNLKSQIKNFKKYNRLEELFHTDYHCETHLTYEAKIRWDDGELTIHFDNFLSLKEFFLKFPLKIDISNFKQDIARTEDEISKSLLKISEIKDVLNLLDVNEIPTVNSTSIGVQQ